MRNIIIIIFFLILFTYIYSRINEKFDDNLQLIKFPNFINRTDISLNIYNKVPLDIYQSWHSHELPIDMAKNIHNLLKINPEFNYHLYSDEDCLNFISKYFNSDVVSAFNTLVPGAYKCDLWRYCVLYINGGVYLDIKFYSVVPLITLIKDNPILFVKDRDFGDDTSTCAEDIHNAFMISPPNNIIFKKCIDDIVNSCKFKLYHRNPLDVTGPCLLGRIILQHDPNNFNNYVKNFRLDGDNIVNGDTIIFKQYANYRNDQDKFQKTKRYPQYWWDKNMYGETLVI